MDLNSWSKVGTLIGGLAVGLSALGAFTMFVSTLTVSDALTGPEEQVSTIDRRIGELDTRLSELADLVNQMHQQLESMRPSTTGAPATGQETQSGENTDFAPVRPIVQRFFNKRVKHPHCRERATDIDWRVDANTGWKILVGSVDLHPVTKTVNSSYLGVKNLSHEGFNVQGTVVNNGQCIRVFGKRVANDARGELHVAGTYSEQEIIR